MGWMSPQQQQFGNRCGNFGMQVGGSETPGEPKIEESHLEKWLHTHVAGSPVMVLVTDLETVLFPCRLNYSFSCPWSCQCHMLPMIWLQLLSAMVWDQSCLLRTQQEIHSSSVSREAGLLTWVLAMDPEGALWLGSRNPNYGLGPSPAHPRICPVMHQEPSQGHSGNIPFIHLEQPHCLGANCRPWSGLLSQQQPC